MENVSKALIMAGAVLIAVLLISLIMFQLANIRQIANVSSAQTYHTQAEAFNRFFVYSKPESEDLIHGYDVYNIIQKAIDCNMNENSMGQIQISYLGVDYSDASYNEIKDIFSAGGKDLMEASFAYQYEINLENGLVNKVIFTK